MPGSIDVGQTIAGKYELVRLLGRGTSSAVWEARHATLGETFALKVLTPRDDVSPEEASARFHEHAKLSAALSKKTRHVVSVTDHGEENGWQYIVMELLEGESLETRLGRGTIEAAETADILGQVARALTAAHADNVFHGDLVPSNIFLCRDEDGRVLVKLLDFGLVRGPAPVSPESEDELEVEGEGEAEGDDSTGPEPQRFAATTSPYASPEQVRGESGLDHRADLWALVVIAYRCLTGTLPWQGDSPEETVVAICTHQWIPARERKPNLPYVVEAFFARGFSLELDDRFKSAKELAATFRAGFPHTERKAGGRAAFASRPSFDEELGPAPKDTSSSRLPAPDSSTSLPAVTSPADPPAPAADAASPATTPAPSPAPAPPTAPAARLSPRTVTLGALALLLLALFIWSTTR